MANLSNAYNLMYNTLDDYLYIENKKFISDYQGRCYVNMANLDYSKPLSPKMFQEYFSVGFETYYSNPDLLKGKDKNLFEYIERMMTSD